MQNLEIVNELERIGEMEEKIARNKMVYKGYKKTYDFTKDKTIHAFGDDIKKGVITMDKANDEQNKLAQKIREFKSNTKPRNSNMMKEKSDVINNEWDDTS